MSDIPPKAIETGNFETVIDYNVLMEFEKLGSPADLHVWRQVNEECYQALNSTFLDSVTKSILFAQDMTSHAAPELFEPAGADEEQNELENNGEAQNEESENVEDEDSAEDDQPDEDEMNEDDDDIDENPVLNPFPTSSHWNRTIVKIIDGENFRVIHPQNWTPKIAHIFRKLEFKEVWISKLENYDLPLHEIVTQLAPYITSLRLNNLPLASENPGVKYSEFLNGFTSLKYLEIDIIVFELYGVHSVQGMSIDQLEIGVASLKMKPKITFYAWEKRQEILAKFGFMENVSFNFHVDMIIRDMEDEEVVANMETTIAEIKNNLGQFGSLKNIKYKLDIGPFPNIAQIEAFTEICVQPEMENQIEELCLILNFDKGTFAEENRLVIVNCLTKLSPFVTCGIFQFRSKPTWDILNHDLEWPKLTNLWIVGYNYPLEILKKCTNLQFLQLEMDQDVCIFHNHQQSEKESLKEYFGNLRQLLCLELLRAKVGDKIADGNELDEYFMEILPKFENIIYDYNQNDED